MDRILLAVDGSDHSMRAAALAGELSLKLSAPVDIVNVVAEGIPVVPDAVHDYAELEHVYLTQRDLLRSVGSDVIAVAAAKVKAAGGDVAAKEVIIGSPAHGIVQFAQDSAADCIVMGRRGLGDMRGFLVGSVSHKVGHLTETTLITVQ